MSTIGKRLRAALYGVLLPATCCLCGASAAPSDLDLCDVCITLLPHSDEPRAGLRGAGSTYVPMVVPFRYAFPVDAWIRGLKFRGERVYGRVLGVLLARSLAAVRGQAAELATLPDLIVPVPLHAARYRQRGFNQVLDIALVAGRRLGVPVDAKTLVRNAATREQSGLTVRERRRNVRGAFEVRRPVTARRVALVDDVVTTGSTVLAAARALRASGVEEIEVWAAARAVLD